MPPYHNNCHSLPVNANQDGVATHQFLQTTPCTLNVGRHILASHPELVHLLYHTNNSLANYDTSPYNPAFNLHPMQFNHHQKHPHYHFHLTDNATRPYNLAFNVHLMLAKYHQKCYQSHTWLQLATHVTVLPRTSSLHKWVPILQQPWLHSWLWHIGVIPTVTTL